MLTGELPHNPVDLCLDDAAMREHLRPLLAPQGQVDAVRVLKARRSASRQRDPHRLVVLYEVDLRDTPRAGPRTLVCHGTVFRGGASAEAAATSAAAGTPAIHVAALDLLLWPWPYDPALPQLLQLLDPQVTRPIVGEAARSIERLRYEPGSRATLRYTHASGRSLYAKTFADARGEILHRRFAWFWQRAQDDAAAPLVARPRAFAQRTLWQDAAPGVPWRESLARGIGAAEWLALADALAAVHAAPRTLGDASPRDTTHWLTEVQRRRKKIGRARPDLAARADATALAIERAAEHLPAIEPALIHGDFHVDQVALHRGRPVLFDFDEFALGDPMEDVASFVVRLPSGEEGDAATAWLAACALCRPIRFCAPRLAWHLAVQQLLQASRAFVFQVPAWDCAVQQRLERAERLAQAAQEAVA